MELKDVRIMIDQIDSDVMKPMIEKVLERAEKL